MIPTYITIEYDMPCGHTMTKCLFNSREEERHSPVTDTAPLMERWLSYWRLMHRCEDVSPRFPNGAGVGG